MSTFHPSDHCVKADMITGWEAFPFDFISVFATTMCWKIYFQTFSISIIYDIYFLWTMYMFNSRRKLYNDSLFCQAMQWFFYASICIKISVIKNWKLYWICSRWIWPCLELDIREGLRLISQIFHKTTRINGNYF